MNFEMVGKISISKESEKFKPWSETKYESGWAKRKIMFNATCRDNRHLLTVDAGAWEEMLSGGAVAEPAARFYGSDRDAGAIRMSTANAERAGVGAWCHFACHGAGELQPPEGPPGLVIVNPPYGARIGNKKLLFALYGALGQVLKERFSGWQVGIVTSETGLAKATQLPFLPFGAPVAHGGLKIRLFRTAPLP